MAVDRRTHVVAVGGGVVGDLAGFVASTFARGLPVWHVPTTLVAQVDSAIGGKTGINLTGGKNLVGVFWQPFGVVADIDTLATLPDREFVSGLAEVVKYGMILDRDFFVWLEENAGFLIRRITALSFSTSAARDVQRHWARSPTTRHRCWSPTLKNCASTSASNNGWCSAAPGAARWRWPTLNSTPTAARP